MIDFKNFPLLEEEPSENTLTPNYLKIYEIIFDVIDKGVLKTGDAVPSENALAEHWNVSRGTVRMAMRRLEEDGYINKTQGKQAVVAAYAYQTKKGIHWLHNVCLENCLETVDETQVEIKYQACNAYIAHELGYEKPGFLVLSVHSNYYAKGCQVANMVTIFHSQFVEEYNLDVNNEEMIKKFVMKDLFQYAKRSKTVMNVLSADEDDVIAGMRPDEPVIIMEEILLNENDKQMAYFKIRLKASKYRFLMERKSPM